MFYQKNLWQGQQGHFIRNSALNAFFYIPYIQSLIYRLNHRVPTAVQSHFWQMTAQISQRVLLKFKMAFGVLHRPEKLGPRCIQRTALHHREVNTPGTDQPFSFVPETGELYSYLHYKELKFQARPENACGLYMG